MKTTSLEGFPLSSTVRQRPMSTRSATRLSWITKVLFEAGVEVIQFAVGLDR
jgi:hypothetical protein